MKAKITSWTAHPLSLEITVAVEPFGMYRSYCWKEYTNNNYGQNQKTQWWGKASSDSYSLELHSEELQEALTKLVLEHMVLSNLSDTYRIGG